jgi:hypothetical protein
MDMSAVVESQVRHELETLLPLAGLQSKGNLIALHLAEIELEADAVLDFVTLFRSRARSEEVELAQEALVELALSLEHLRGHIDSVLPELSRQLDLTD